MIFKIFIRQFQLGIKNQKISKMSMIETIEKTLTNGQIVSFIIFDNEKMKNLREIQHQNQKLEFY